MSNHIPVTIKSDFLEKQTHAQPLNAISELIWNSLDADADVIRVKFEYGNLNESPSKIIISDNGSGIPRSKIVEYFGNLGGSWKQKSPHTLLKGRIVHGKDGKGRYKALALGSHVSWISRYSRDGVIYEYSITLSSENINDVYYEEEIMSSNETTGVDVIISNLNKNYAALITDEGIQELSEMFALYMMNYGDVSIYIGDSRLDPKSCINNSIDFTLSPITDFTGSLFDVNLTIVEWKKDTRRILYLCSPDGFPFGHIETRFHVPFFGFSAYLKSEYITKIFDNESFALSEMDEQILKSTNEARDKIKEYFTNRASQQAKLVVEEWKNDNIYPFEGEPNTLIEKAERQVFDIIAVNVQNYVPDLLNVTNKTKAFHLKMIRHAIESGPSDLQLIFREVLKLPERKQKELAELLKETSLSSIIAASKTVADRLKYISGLESIIFDPENKRTLKERSQLHKIVADNSWIFGERYNLWVSDKDLKKVLIYYKEKLKIDIDIEEPVKVIDKKRGIIDLMLSRSARGYSPGNLEHLVVELKAPKVKIGNHDTSQIKRYAFAVKSDERYASIENVKWHFWLIGNECDEYTSMELNGGPDPNNRILHKENNLTVYVKTWAEIIEENKSRLQFFKEKLEYSMDDDSAMEYLRNKYSRFMSGIGAAEEGAEVDNSESNGEML